MDLSSLRRQYGRFLVERRDWPVDEEEFVQFEKRGPEPSGAAALIWGKDRSILLVREASRRGKLGGWSTPGGFAEPREPPEECVRRETKEEAGVDVRITALTKVILCFVAHGDRELPYAFFQFEGQHAGGAPRPGDGIAEVAWFDRLPDDLHFRADYVEPWRRGRPAL